MKFFARHNIHIIRAGATYDFIASVGFAPPFAAATLATLRHMHTALRMGGSIPAFTVQQLLFTNLMGIVIILWALLRLIKPLPYYGFVDALARVVYATTMLYYIVVLHVSTVLAGFACLEILWATLQTMGYLGYRRATAKS